MNRVFDFLALNTLVDNRAVIKRTIPDEDAYLAATTSSRKLLDLLRTEKPDLERLDVVRAAITLVSKRADEVQLAVFMAGALDWYEEGLNG